MLCVIENRLNVVLCGNWSCIDSIVNVILMVGCWLVSFVILLMKCVSFVGGWSCVSNVVVCGLLLG